MELTEAMSMLARTPAALEALLRDTPHAWLHRTDGPGTWSAYDILGHLADADAVNWLPRARLILEHGPRRTFVPFDREAMLRAPRQPVGELLARWTAARQASLIELGALDLRPRDLDRRGSHPEFGEVTLGQLLASWVAHDLTHVGQVAEVLARRLRSDVGPWRAYMPALDGAAPAE
ncbi:MAG: DinB family protein [Hamadaea sp.]|nr:DinB family protein [Hamadaea sp.]